MPSTATVTQRPRARRAAALPAAKSICAISQPPKMSPAGLVSEGIAIVRMTASRSLVLPASMAHSSRHHWPDFEGSTVDHLDSHVENDSKTHVGDPVVLLEQAGDEASGDPHQSNRQDKAEDKDDRMVLCGSRDCQHVVERHRHVGDNNLPRCLSKRLARGMFGDQAILIEVAVLQGFFGLKVLLGMAGPQLAPHLPAHPEQENTAGEKQADDLEELGRETREDDAQDGSRNDA